MLKLNGNMQLRIKSFVPAELLDTAYILFFQNKSIDPSHHHKEHESLGGPSTELSMAHCLSTERPLAPEHPK